MCSKVYENPTAKAKVVYNEASDRIRDQLDEASRQEWDMEFPTLQQMRPSIYKWRRDIIPANPHTRSEIVTNTSWSRMASGEGTIKGDRLVQPNDPNYRIILQSSNKVMKEALRLASTGVMDATFSVSSPLFPQLFIITMYLGGAVWRPVAYIHMPNKGQSN